jgi:hypothetical protein
VVLKTNKNLAVTTFNKPAIFSRGKDLIRSFWENGFFLTKKLENQQEPE